MAFASTSEEKEISHDEYLCPICLDEFTEPKILQCFHNLCRKCIDDLANSTTENLFIRCPLCRSKCRIPNGGAKNLPPNRELEKLVREAPATRAKQEIKEAVNDCKEGCKIIKDLSKRIDRALNHEGNKIKHRIHESCENIVDMIRLQEKQLFKDVDILISNQQEVHPVAVLSKRTEGLINDVEEILKQNEARSLLQDKDTFIHHLGEAKLAGSKLHHMYAEIRLKTSTMEFERNRQVMQCLSSSLFGNVNYRNEARKVSASQTIMNKGLTSGLEILKPGTRFRSLTIPSSLEHKFHPFAISGSCQGKVAVTDQGSHSILLYKENGEFSQRIGYRGPDNGQFQCPTGVTFLSPHIVAVADGCLFGNPSRLQAFDSSGRFVRCLTKLSNNTHWFTHISALNSQQIIITCSNIALYYESYVQVLNTDGTIFLAFGATGEGKLTSPIKTIHLNDEYFVSDCDKSTNRCMIKVFDDKGRYLRSFGECMLKSDIEDNPFYPLIILEDPHCNLILAYSGLFKVIRCYKPDGSLVSYYGTISGIIDMVLSKDRRLFAICDGSAEFPHSVQILFHT
ncbi:hypothetical protein QZH41_003152 [Actinostola sp. cb2023]|nr:hypothetical protein QZH41_003152 [Actinostola sp. cb2023]